MHGKLARSAARAVAIAAMAAAGPGFAQVAQAAAAAVTDVPCNAAALAGDMSSASSGETLNLASRCAYQLTAGLPVVNTDLVIAGNGATLERSYARGVPAFTILTADSGNLTVKMLNFRNGNGAISIGQDAALTVDGGIFTGNTAADGGAIYDQSIGGPDVNGATFIANTATDSGGAICMCGEDGGVIQDAAFVGNKAAQAGGAISDDVIDGPYVSASTFSRNTAAEGGALYLNPGAGGSVLSHIAVRGNQATGDGGGIYTFNSLDITGSEITGNHGGGEGGGLLNGGLDAVSVRDTGFQRNSARDGGGVYNGSFGSIDLTGSTISGNHASADGGGIYTEPETFVSFEHSTIAGDFAGAYGGGIYDNAGQVAATSTQIVRNTAATGGGGIYDYGGATATLTSSPVLSNKPDNCEPADSIAGCANVSRGPSGPIISGYRKTVCVDDSNDSRANDTKIVMWACSRTAGQDWAIDADGTIRINGKCMDVYRDEKNNKAPVELWTCTGGANQQWHAVNGTLVNPVSGKCFDDPRFNTADGTQLEIYTCNGGANQQWKLP
jgi:predicted outer membrane repeat protein